MKARVNWAAVRSGVMVYVALIAAWGVVTLLRLWMGW